MTDKTHQLIGLTAATSVFLYQHPDLPITWAIAGTVIIGSFFGSILPDIDQPTANIWDTVPLGGVVGHITARALGGHRNLSHSILGVLLFSWIMIWLAHHIPTSWFLEPQFLTESFITGFIAHLAADSVTVRGIPLFWPLGNDMGFPPYPLDGLRIVTGKWFEHLVVLPLVILAFGAIILSHSARLCPLAIGLCH